MFNFIKGASLVALATFTFSSCGGGVDQSKPESVALAFTKAIASMDFDGAKKYCDTKTGELIGMMGGMAKGKMAEMKPEDKAKMEEAQKSLKSATCKVDGDKAACTICCGPDGKDSPEAVNLVKEGGKWLVAIDKEGGKRGEEPVIEEPVVEPSTAVDSTAVDTTGTN
jgi:hypothetical protein